MLIATFGQSTGWAGKTITREGDAFILEGHGPITATDVMEYDQQGHLIWANDGTRAWVGARARVQVQVQVREQTHMLTPTVQKVYESRNGPMPIDFVICGRSDECLIATKDRCVIVKPLPRLAKKRFTEFHPEGSSWVAEEGQYTEFRYEEITEIGVYEWGPSKRPVIEVVTPTTPANPGGAQGADPSGLPNCLSVRQSALLDGDGPQRIDELFRRAGLTTGLPSSGAGQGAFSTIVLSRRREISQLAIIGLLLAIGGLIAVVYFIAAFDTSVPVGEYGMDRANNIGLMNDQRNGIIGGVLAIVGGGVLLVIAYSRGELDDWLKPAPATNQRKCPYCAETIKAEAAVCRFCNRDVSQGTAG